MSLTTGRGPLSPSPAGRFTKEVPEGVGYVEPHPRRIVGERDGTAVIAIDACPKLRETT